MGITKCHKSGDGDDGNRNEAKQVPQDTANSGRAEKQDCQDEQKKKDNPNHLPTPDGPRRRQDNHTMMNGAHRTERVKR